MARDFYSDEFNNLEPPESVKDFGHIEAAHVEIRGICHACAAKDEAGSTTQEDMGAER